MSNQKIELPSKLRFLTEEKHRYKGARGGRGSAKSWSFARALLLLGGQETKRILCTRELQKSIKDSVHQLICDQIAEMNMGYWWEIQAQAIKHRSNGTAFGFAGLRHNIMELKSYEGADIAWVEEAQAVSKKSWEILVPTIRKEGSEIWVSFNPELEDDETYQRFVIHPPKDSRIEVMNWRDNPWFPEVLRQEMEELKERDPDSYLHVWEGHPRQVLEGAIFAKELRQAKLEERITDVPHDPSKPVHTFWDLGWNSVSGRTAIIMAQSHGPQYRIIDYLEDAEHTVQWYIKQLEDKPYVWGTDYLPHDAMSTNLAAGGRTVQKIMGGLGRSAKVILKTPSVNADIEVCRTIFPMVWIDRTKCSDLLQCLNRYKYKIDEETGLRSKNPEPSIYIHGADAFRQFARAIKQDKEPVKPKPRQSTNYAGPGAWMG